MDTKDINDYYGLWHKDYSPKKSFYTYQILTRMCPSKSTRPKLVKVGEKFIATWKRPDRKRAWAIWSPRMDKANIIIKGKYSSFDCYGNKISISKDYNLISPSVIYIIGAKEVLIK